MRGLAGSRVAKVRLLFGLCKAFEGKNVQGECKKANLLVFLPSRSHFYAKNVQGECKKASLLVFLPSRSHFYAKSVEMEAIFNRCWVLEIQNAASTNQRGATTNQIGRSEGLDVTLIR